MLLASGLVGADPGRGRAGSLYRPAADSPAPWQDVGVPLPAPAPLSRRRFVAAAAGVAGLVAAGGCGLPAVDDAPDPLLELAEAAGRDADELAVADASHGESVAPLRLIADARRVHAERLYEEIARQRDADAEPPREILRPAPVCPPLEEVRSRLRADARRAAEVAAGTEGYRASLVAAVSASCTAAVEVVLG